MTKEQLEKATDAFYRASDISMYAEELGTSIERFNFDDIVLQKIMPLNDWLRVKEFADTTSLHESIKMQLRQIHKKLEEERDKALDEFARL